MVDRIRFFVEQRCPGFGAGGFRRIERQLGEKTLTRCIPCGDLLQLFQIADSGHEWSYSLSRYGWYHRRRSLPGRSMESSSRQLNHAVAEFTPMRRRCGRDAEAFECFECEVAFG